MVLLVPLLLPVGTIIFMLLMERFEAAVLGVADDVEQDADPNGTQAPTGSPGPPADWAPSTAAEQRRRAA